ncbi:MAG: ATP synthase subunit I [Candidatus Aminicenantes bacterium]|nr:ATP synthase subunit I [Candidatus Aminicenantes bacterium]
MRKEAGHSTWAVLKYGPKMTPMSPDSSEKSGGTAVNSFEQTALRRIPFEIIILTAVVASVLAFAVNPATGLFFFAGGALAAISFLWMKSTVAKILSRNKAEAVRTGLLFYALRFILILGVFFLIILAYPNRILAFAAGFSMVIPAFVVEAVKAFALMKQWKA